MAAWRSRSRSSASGLVAIALAALVLPSPGRAQDARTLAPDPVPQSGETAIYVDQAAPATSGADLEQLSASRERPMTPTAGSTRRDSAPRAIVPIDGSDVCDAEDAPRPKVCDNTVERRAEEFARPVSVLVVDLDPVAIERSGANASEVSRLAKESGEEDAENLTAQALASIVLGVPTAAPVESRDPSAPDGLDALIDRVIEAGGNPQVMGK